MGGRRLAGSSLVGQHSRTPRWVTFSGSYDLGFLLKLLTCGRALPPNAGTFDAVLVTFCPRRHELRDELSLQRGSLDHLARKHEVVRHGPAHTAGSDALLTLELYLRVVGVKGRGQDKSAEFAKDAQLMYDVRQWCGRCAPMSLEAQQSHGWDDGWGQTTSRWSGGAWGNGAPFPSLASAQGLPWLQTPTYQTPHWGDAPNMLWGSPWHSVGSQMPLDPAMQAVFASACAVVSAIRS